MSHVGEYFCAVPGCTRLGVMLPLISVPLGPGGSRKIRGAAAELLCLECSKAATLEQLLAASSPSCLALERYCAKRKLPAPEWARATVTYIPHEHAEIGRAMSAASDRAQAKGGSS